MNNNWWKIAVVAALIIVVAIVVAGKNKDTGNTDAVAETTAMTIQPEDSSVTEDNATVNNQDSPESAEQTASDVPEQPAKSESPVKPASDADNNTPAAKAEPVQTKAVSAKPAVKTTKKLPRLVDLGASKCVPCKMMAPILEELGKEYKGKLIVDFYDVWVNEGKGKEYGIKTIPTQIFYDENGKEFFRHEGFYAKEDILAKFKEQGIDLGKGN